MPLFIIIHARPAASTNHITNSRCPAGPRSAPANNTIKHAGSNFAPGSSLAMDDPGRRHWCITHMTNLASIPMVFAWRYVANRPIPIRLVLWWWYVANWLILHHRLAIYLLSQVNICRLGLKLRCSRASYAFQKFFELLLQCAYPRDSRLQLCLEVGVLVLE